jgi:hypothetical protein
MQRVSMSAGSPLLAQRGSAMIRSSAAAPMRPSRRTIAPIVAMGGPSAGGQSYNPASAATNKASAQKWISTWKARVNAGMRWPAIVVPSDRLGYASIDCPFPTGSLQAPRLPLEVAAAVLAALEEDLGGGGGGGGGGGAQRACACMQGSCIPDTCLLPLSRVHSCIHPPLPAQVESRASWTRP